MFSSRWLQQQQPYFQSNETFVCYTCIALHCTALKQCAHSYIRLLWASVLFRAAFVLVKAKRREQQQKTIRNSMHLLSAPFKFYTFLVYVWLEMSARFLGWFIGWLPHCKCLKSLWSNRNQTSSDLSNRIWLLFIVLFLSQTHFNCLCLSVFVSFSLFIIRFVPFLGMIYLFCVKFGQPNQSTKKKNNREKKCNVTTNVI